MSRCVIDTNVPIVANGRPDPSNGNKLPAVDCRRTAIEFLIGIIDNGRVLLDLEGAIQGEYRRYLSPSGQPGTGDRFYQEILHSSPRVVERVSLEKRPDGEYQALPQTLMDIGFDPSDRKFAALAKSENVPVVNATDSDWLERFHELQASGIKVWNLCGCDSNAWFVDP